MLDTFMRQLSKELEADPPLEASLPGLYEYYVREDLAVVIKGMQPQGLTLTANLGPYPKDQEAEFLESMIKGNLFGKETFGAVIGLDLEGKNMMLSRHIDRRIDYREFKEILEDFVHIANFWRKEAGLAPIY